MQKTTRVTGSSSPFGNNARTATTARPAPSSANRHASKTIVEAPPSSPRSSPSSIAAATSRTTTTNNNKKNTFLRSSIGRKTGDTLYKLYKNQPPTTTTTTPRSSKKNAPVLPQQQRTFGVVHLLFLVGCLLALTEFKIGFSVQVRSEFGLQWPKTTTGGMVDGPELQGGGEATTTKKKTGRWDVPDFTKLAQQQQQQLPKSKATAAKGGATPLEQSKYDQGFLQYFFRGSGVQFFPTQQQSQNYVKEEEGRTFSSKLLHLPEDEPSSNQTTISTPLNQTAAAAAALLAAGRSVTPVTGGSSPLTPTIQVLWVNAPIPHPPTDGGPVSTWVDGRQHFFVPPVTAPMIQQWFSQRLFLHNTTCSQSSYKRSGKVLTTANTTLAKQRMCKAAMMSHLTGIYQVLSLIHI